MSEIKDLRAGGFVSFWSLGDNTDRAKLLEGLTAAGFGGFVPEPKTGYHALRETLERIFAGKKVMIRALAKNRGCEVLEEVQGETQNSYKHLLSVTIADEGATLAFLDWSSEEYAIKSMYDARRKTIHAFSVSACLVRLVASLKGTSLRPTGGFYWTPDESRAQWDAVVKAIENSGDGNAVYTLTLKYDSEMIRAVTAAITNEVAAAAGELEREVNSGDFGPRALESKQKSAQALTAKVRTYEQLIGGTLASLTEKLNSVEALTAQAIMDAAVAAAS